MKVLMKSKDKGTLTLVDTRQDPSWAERFLALESEAKPKENAPSNAQVRFKELQEIGYIKLGGEERKEYKSLKSQLQ